ncbi:beta-lactamase regulating signal transducer with metallopeptidase domain [Lacrimispora xylanisolvens]|uniref:Beta-lactamase regulating signal transducer with metallopeptidase domain n=1 Tax=Lacrimispora xylanisolvens TaxID=384636 RepID=A0A2S6HZ14_9FIRM|nr:M56 family metallopeptidase [Hungatella xylanolytica]PPK83298.1 beta-lactamase regulating signal transducer with metallopeptidase domain [Hungatella xylanolytica]
MLESVFIQLLNMSLTASIAIAFVLAVRTILRKAPKVFSYLLWSVVLFRLICPFSFESIFSLMPAKANPISQDILYMQTPKIDTGIGVINHSVNAILPAATPQTSANPLQILIVIFSHMWLFGVAAMLVYSLFALFRLKKELMNATLYRDNIFISSRIDTAFVMGIFCPKIYLPSNLNAAERSYILLHEQTHIRRLDHIFKLISFLALCIHWFNPFVWAAFFLSGKDMEMSCDEAVIKRLGDDVKKDYSASLLTLATGKRIVSGTPLAFGEGDTKGRIRNVLNYRKPGFWAVLVSVLAVVFVVIGLTTSPKDLSGKSVAVNATILKIDKINQTITVKGIDTNSPIGDNCIVNWKDANLQTVINKEEPVIISIDDFTEGDHVVLFLGEIQESYPTRAKATTIQLEPKETLVTTYPIKDLWDARTKYVGDNSAVGKLIGLLPVPIGMQYDHFELQTASPPHKVTIVYSVPAQSLSDYKSESSAASDTFRANALFLLALIENADEIHVTLTDGSQKIEFTNGREWADNIVEGEVTDYGKSPEKLQELTGF